MAVVMKPVRPGLAPVARPAQRPPARQTQASTVLRAPRTVVLDNSKILNLARNKSAVLDFPVLQTVAKAIPSGGCSSCTQRKKNSSVLDSARSSFVGLSADKLAALKRYLSADRIYISYVSGGRTANILI